METQTFTQSHNLSKGLLAGLIGGVVGAGVILVAEEIFSPRTQGESSPLAVLAGGGESEPEATAPRARQALHWAIGAAAGGIYGAAAEMEPSLSAWHGAAFGVTLNRITHESLLPQLGLAPPPEDQSTRARVSSWISHAAYGIATDSVRRLVRRLI